MLGSTGALALGVALGHQPAHGVLVDGEHHRRVPGRDEARGPVPEAGDDEALVADLEGGVDGGVPVDGEAEIGGARLEAAVGRLDLDLGDRVAGGQGGDRGGRRRPGPCRRCRGRRARRCGPRRPCGTGCRAPTAPRPRARTAPSRPRPTSRPAPEPRPPVVRRRPAGRARGGRGDRGTAGKPGAPASVTEAWAAWGGRVGPPTVRARPTAGRRSGASAWGHTRSRCRPPGAIGSAPGRAAGRGARTGPRPCPSPPLLVWSTHPPG